MSSNFYLVRGEYYVERDPAHPLSSLLEEGSGRPPMIHIGKSNSGWCFCLHVYPHSGIHTLSDWKNFALGMLAKNVGWRVEDDFRAVYTLDQLWVVVERSGWNREDGRPFLRHYVDGVSCIGHGDGSYDYMIGHFS